MKISWKNILCILTTGLTLFLFEGSIYNFILNADGYPSYPFVNYTNGVRPSISLKTGFTIADNDAGGSVNNPYVVVTDS